MEHELVLSQFDALFEGETNLLAVFSNTSALLKENFEDQVNWVGFYFLEDTTLVLGPFQGKSACIRLYQYKGVCQKALELNSSLIVSNVLEFAGHIACDSASKSELVVPIYKDGKAIGVLDIDSPSFRGFSYKDLVCMKGICKKIEEKL